MRHSNSHPNPGRDTPFRHRNRQGTDRTNKHPSQKGKRQGQFSHVQSHKKDFHKKYRDHVGQPGRSKSLNQPVNRPTRSGLIQRKAAADLLNQIRFLLGCVIETVQYVEYNLSLALRYAKMKKDLQSAIQRKGNVSVKDAKAITKNAADYQDDISEITLGALLATIDNANIMPKKDLDEMEDILKTRNLLVHQFFKKNDFESQKENLAFLTGQINYLNKFLNRINNFNDMLYKKIADAKASLIAK